MMDFACLLPQVENLQQKTITKLSKMREVFQGIPSVFELITQEASDEAVGLIKGDYPDEGKDVAFELPRTRDFQEPGQTSHSPAAATLSVRHAVSTSIPS